jgi:hypothetical protein
MQRFPRHTTFENLPTGASKALRAKTCQGQPGEASSGMKFTAVFEPAKEGGYTCFVEEVPAAISQGEHGLAQSFQPEARQRRATAKSRKEGTVYGVCKQLEIPRP